MDACGGLQRERHGKYVKVMRANYSSSSIYRSMLRSAYNFPLHRVSHSSPVSEMPLTSG